MIFKKARWVIDERFHQKQPLDLRAKTQDGPATLDENPGHPLRLRNTHVLFRLKFKAENYNKVILNYSADDIAKIYVNGRFIEIGPPPSYHFRYACNSVDITGYIQKGMNVVSAHLYYHGELNRSRTSGDFRIGFIAEVISDNAVVAYTDEDTLCRISNAFKNGGLTGHKTQYLENFDANEWEYDWSTVEFDDTNWTTAFVKRNNDHTFYRQETRALQCYDVKPEETRVINKNVVLYDFGCGWYAKVS